MIIENNLPLTGEINYVKPGEGWRQIHNTDKNGEASVSAELDMSYIERRDNWSQSEKKKETFGDNLVGNYCQKADVATFFGSCQPSVSNFIGTKHPGFVFLDVGKWKGKARDFGLIWGRHVYLCSFDCNKYSNEFINRFGSCFEFSKKNFNRDKGLDYQFFNEFYKGFTGDHYIRIQAYTYAEGGLTNEYNWDCIYVIIPDLHLMSVETATDWYSYMSPKYFNLDAEVDLMYFTRNIIRLSDVIGKDKIHIIQIGDCYDLWVGLGRNYNNLILPDYTPYWSLEKTGENNGFGAVQNDAPLHSDEVNSVKKLPLFTENEKENMFIYEKVFFWDGDKPTVMNSRKYLSDEIKKIQTLSKEELESCNKAWLLDKNSTYMNLGGYERQTNKYLNPAEVALKNLQKTFSKNQMTYIYGNHDNYLIDPFLPDMAGLWKREAFYNEERTPALFVEHGHRMEAIFTDPLLPKNHDGSISGFVSTNELFYYIKKHDFGFLRNYILKTGANSADDWAGNHDQPAYRSEFIRFYLGRMSRGKPTPHIFVIGHTHMPELYNIQIKGIVRHK